MLSFLQQADVGTVTGSKNHRDIGFQAADAGVGFGAIHLGQDHVKKQQIDLVAVVFEFAYGCFAVVGGYDRIAETFEGLAGEIAKAFVIFGDKNQFGTAANRLHVVGEILNFPGGNRKRKIHAKGGADVELAVDMQEAAVLTNDAVNGSKAQARAFADILGGKKRFENTVKSASVHSCPGIGDREHGIASGPGMRLSRELLLVEHNFPGFNEELAALGHSIAGVDAQVHDDLFDLGRIGPNHGQIWGQIRFDFNIAAEDFFQEAESFGDVLIEIYVARLENLAAGEGEQLTGQGGRPNGLMPNFIEVAVEASVGVGFVHAEFGPTEDGPNHVVKVVSDPTSQLADGFKFLGLANLLFQGQAFGNLLNDNFGTFGFSPGIPSPPADQPHGDDFAVGALPVHGDVRAIGGPICGQDLAANGRITKENPDVTNG